MLGASCARQLSGTAGSDCTFGSDQLPQAAGGALPPAFGFARAVHARFSASSRLDMRSLALCRLGTQLGYRPCNAHILRTP